ncbi:MAG: hypothetical protein AAFQ10_03950 [Pseudomonadota bacterium]
MTKKSILGNTAFLAGMVVWAMQATAGETYYSTSGLKQLLTGKKLTLVAGGVISYARNGRYTFQRQGQTYRGKWSVRRGRVCVTFINNNRRCDKYVKESGSIYFENAQGGRFKIKSVR